MRIAIVNDKCRPQDCGQECKKECPVVRMGKLCVVVSKKSKKAEISELLCNGCGICTKKCPFNAIKIINLPKNIGKKIHKYGNNSFELYNLPKMTSGKVLGLVGRNGIGKSTILKILAGKLLPNMGDYDSISTPETILEHFKGDETQKYFTKLFNKEVKTFIKPQYIDYISKNNDKTVKSYFEKYTDLEKIKLLELDNIYDKQIRVLSGGELQRFAIAMVILQEGDCYMFDEPTAYLDVKQRLNCAKSIRNIINDTDKYVVCVEHDLCTLDYLSDLICVLYGEPSAYGVVAGKMSVGNGINAFLDGYLPQENMRFRSEKLDFSFSKNDEVVNGKMFVYPEIIRDLPGFKISIESGNFCKSEIVMLLGENGTGKTSFLKLILQHFKDTFKISFKKQILKKYLNYTVKDLIYKKVNYGDALFQSEIFRPLDIENLMELNCKDLSGGELQRLNLCICLAKKADVYLIDEVSAYLDSEQRLECSKIIKRFILNNKKCCFMVEHDFLMATYLADKVVVFSGTPSLETTAHAPEALVAGMNKFLKQLNITYRKDKDNGRPRINKLNSVKDTEQKKSGNYFF